VGLPNLLSEIVAGALDGQPDVVVARNEGDLADAVQRTGATVVIVSDESVEPRAIADLLRLHPDVTLVGISADGRQAYAYQPLRIALGELSPESLQEAVRHSTPSERAG
jgi:hypothetical protein